MNAWGRLLSVGRLAISSQLTAWLGQGSCDKSAGKHHNVLVRAIQNQYRSRRYHLSNKLSLIFVFTLKRDQLPKTRCFFIHIICGGIQASRNRKSRLSDQHRKA